MRPLSLFEDVSGQPPPNPMPDSAQKNVSTPSDLKLLIFSGLVCFSYLWTPLVRAQQDIFQKESRAEEIAATTQTYSSLMTAYRRAETEFTRSQAEYRQLRTLRSYDTALSDIRELYAMRAAVLATYFELLELELLDAAGVPLELKESALDQLSSVRAVLREQEGVLRSDTQTTKLFIETEQIAFAQLYPDLLSASYKTQLLVSLGELQSAFDSATAIRVEIAENHAESSPSALVQGQRERAYVEVDELIGSTEDTLAQLTRELVLIQAESNQFSQSYYRSTTETLASIKADLDALLPYLAELNTL